MSDRESSSSSSPSATNPDMEYPTTPKNDHLNAQAPGELSPPGSQEAQSSRFISSRQQVPEDTAMDMQDDFEDDGEPLGLGEQGSRSGGASNDTDMKGGKYVPGSGWNNKKTQDEYHRALENVVDQDFNLQEFGDPLLDDILGKTNGANVAKS